jgi:hypothetical protein
MRHVARLLLPVLALAVVATTSGCATLTSRPNAARTGEIRAAVTAAQAQAVWARFAAARTADPRKGSEKAALARLSGTFSGTSLVVESAALRLDRRARSGKGSSPAATYGEPTLLVPRVFGYPKWFAVRVRAQLPTAAGAPAAKQTRFLVFVRTRAGSGWRQDYEVGVPEALVERLPDVFVDGDGLAEAVPPETGDGLVLAPAAVGAAWAAAVVAGTPAKGAAVSGETFRRRRLADRDGDVLGLGESTSVGYTAKARPGPSFALRTKDGGALVLFATDDVRTYGPAPGAAAGLKIAVTGDYALLAGATQLRTMRVARLDQWLAAVPPREGAAQVLGARSGLVKVSGER